MFIVFCVLVITLFLALNSINCYDCALRVGYLPNNTHELKAVYVCTNIFPSYQIAKDNISALSQSYRVISNQFVVKYFSRFF